MVRRIIAVVVALSAGTASAQYVLSGNSGDEPNLVCKASPMRSDTYYASETVPNTREARRRFQHYADEYGKEIGDRMHVTCEEYERMTPEYDASWRPGSYVAASGKTIVVEKAPFLPRNWDTTPLPDEQPEKSERKAVAAPKADARPDPAPERSASAADDAAARRAAEKAAFEAEHAEWERQAELRERALAEYEESQREIAEKKAQQAAAAQKAAEAFRRKQEAHAETLRQHQEEVARYERELANQRMLADFDRKHGLVAKAEASTDSDANRCISTPQTKLDDTFKGNTSASIVNGCGQPIDVRICLMTADGWNCGVRSGVQGQAIASFSSFNATGQVFTDAKISGSSKVLAQPN